MTIIIASLKESFVCRLLIWKHFSMIIFGSNRPARRAQRTSPAAGRFDGVASDSNRLPWQPTNPQRFGPHFGIRPLLDQSEYQWGRPEFSATFSSGSGTGCVSPMSLESLEVHIQTGSDPSCLGRSAYLAQDISESLSAQLQCSKKGGDSESGDTTIQTRSTT
jgi:hypothetical protein